MPAVTIHDSRSTGSGSLLSFDLIDILDLVKTKVRLSWWRCTGVECVGEQAEALHQVSDAGKYITGVELMRLAGGVNQVIEGDFTAIRSPGEAPWLVIRAVDSSLYVVASRDPEVIAAIRGRFQDVRNSPRDDLGG